MLGKKTKLNFSLIYSRIGNRYGNLVITDFEGYLLLNETYYRYLIAYACKCDCGNEVVMDFKNLRKGVDTACGKEGCSFSIILPSSNWGSGNSKHELYPVFSAMLARCNNPKTRNYYNYGGRGITVCERWNDFSKFPVFVEDMGARPEGYSLDRIDNDGPYSPENCRWASRGEQARNTRSNNYVTIMGITKPLVAWGEVFGIPDSLLRNRLRNRWPMPFALFFPKTHPSKTRGKIIQEEKIKRQYKY